MGFVGIEVTAKLVTDKMKEILGSIDTVVVFGRAELVVAVGTMAVEG